MPDIDEVYQLAQPARVLYVVDNITTGEPWACIRVIAPSAPWVDIGVPAHVADRVVMLINAAHRDLNAALEGYIAGNPDWRGHAGRLVKNVRELKNLGRPLRAPGEPSKPEKIVAHYLEHAAKATLEAFPEINETTLRKYATDAGVLARGERLQWSRQ